MLCGERWCCSGWLPVAEPGGRHGWIRSAPVGASTPVVLSTKNAGVTVHGRLTDMQADRHAGTLYVVGRQTCRQTNMQADRHAGGLYMVGGPTCVDLRSRPITAAAARYYHVAAGQMQMACRAEDIDRASHAGQQASNRHSGSSKCPWSALSAASGLCLQAVP